jgi:hypothetical protein
MVTKRAPVASSQSRVGVRAIRITTALQPGQRITIPIPCAYTSNAPTGVAIPQVAHVVRADVKSWTNSSLSIPAATFPSSLAAASS